MIEALRFYCKLLRPWLTVVVYLWSLQLIADFSLGDPEPWLDRFAGCAAILWTLAFWASTAVVVMWLIALLFTQGRALILNGLGAQTALILITAFFFVRWLFNWANLLKNGDVVPYVLTILCLVMGAWVWRREKHPRHHLSRTVLLDNGWLYFALPLLIVSGTVISVKVGNILMTLRSNRAAMMRARDHSALAGRSEPRPNIVMIVSDALRAQSMSLYGYRRKTTPFLENLARRSVVYTQMYSNSTSTRTSLTSILTGKHPLTHGRLTKFLPPYDSPENLVALLRDNGYTTAAVSSNSDATFYALGLTKYLVRRYPNFRRLTLSWLRDNGVYLTSLGNRMYDELTTIFPFLGFPAKSLGYGPAEDTLKVAARLTVELPEPFFLFVHVHEPHDPYRSPAPFRGKYARLDYAGVNARIVSGYYGRYTSDLQPFVDEHRNHYDESIEYLDSELSKFVQFFEGTGRGRNSLLIITGDHGESFERGFLNHGEDLYESSIHVPLIVKFPGQKEGHRSSAPVQSIDLAPTIVHAIGLAIPKWIDGIPVAIQERASAPRERLVVNYKDPMNGKIFDRPTKVAIRWLQYKLIVTCDSSTTELYDIRNDPDEQVNLAGTEKAVVKDLQLKLKEHLLKQSHDPKLTCANL